MSAYNSELFFRKIAAINAALSRIQHRLCCLQESIVAAGGVDTVLGLNQPLSATRTIDINGNSFNIVDGASNYFYINPSDGKIRLSNPDGNKHIFLSDDDDEVIVQYNTSTYILLGNGSNTIAYTADKHIFNAGGTEVLELNGIDFESTLTAEDGTASSFIRVTGDLAGNNVLFRLAADDGTNPQVKIIGDAIAQTLGFTSVRNIFNGVLNLPVQAAPASPVDGDIWREDNTNTGLKVRINGITKTITVT